MYYEQWLKFNKFGVATPIRERLATPIWGVGTLMCQKLDVWERRSRPFPLTLNTNALAILHQIIDNESFHMKHYF